MYEQSSFLIAGVLFISMIVAVEAGYRLGLRAQSRATESSRSHINAIQASLLGILALVLAFTLSIALQRFESRSQAVVDEANAIGTAYLRAQLLPAPVGDDVLQSLREYVNLRVREGEIALNSPTERKPVIAQINQTLVVLWRYAVQIAADNPQPVPSGMFIQSLNDLIDANGRHEAALERHVPDFVLWLLFGVIFATAGVVGFAVGSAGHRPSLVSYIMVVLIALLVFAIIDLDRPRRGLIQVSQQSLIDVQTAMNSGTSP